MNLIRRRKASNQTEKTSALDSKTKNKEEDNKNKKAVAKKKKKVEERGSKWSCIDSCCWFIGFICTVWWFLLFLYNAMPASFPQFVMEAITGPLPDPPGVKLSKEGLMAKHPVVFVPGIVIGGLELWEEHQCAEGLFRKPLWGGTFGEVYKRLYLASVKGDVNTLYYLIQENPLILEKATVGCSDQNPLHIAALVGHLEFTRVLLSLNTNLATKSDSSGRCPLHLASEKGHVEIVRDLLLHANDDVCLRVDEEGRIPLHLAAMQGHVNVIMELIGARPKSINEVTNKEKNGTVLHLCVRYNRLEALKLLLDLAPSDSLVGDQDDDGNTVLHNDSLIRAQDDDGNTVLHLAAAFKRTEIIKYLLSLPNVKEKLAKMKNKKKFTALDVLEQPTITDAKSIEIRDILHQAGVSRGDLPKDQKIARSLIKCLLFTITIDDDWLKDYRGHLITTSTVIATVAFQAGVTPPGAVWQDDVKGSFNNTTQGSHEAGTSIIATKHSSLHTQFVFSNTLSFLTSVIVILLLISGVASKNKVLMGILNIAVFYSIIFMVTSYSLSVEMMIPRTDNMRTLLVIKCNGAAYICCAVFFFVALPYLFYIANWVRSKLERKRSK